MTKAKAKKEKPATRPAPPVTDTMLIMNGTKFCLHLEHEKVRPGEITEVTREIGEALIKKYPEVDCYDHDAEAGANRIL